ncbi:MAG TPA: hypothetical protein VNZ44_03325 [Pyrinomonadaceae bacterium]|nr:hypothetical protein [Pyrinomonadaceae bacterium]
MSDFLDRLIERSFGLSPVVRPRLPSLFEPPSLDAAAAQPEPPSSAFAEPTPTGEPRAAIPDAPAPANLTHAAPSRRQPPREFAPPAADEPAAQPLTRPTRATTAPPVIESSDYAPPEPRRSLNASTPPPGRRETPTPEPRSSAPAPPSPAPLSAAAPPPAHTPPEVYQGAQTFTPPRAAAEEHGTTPPNSFEQPVRREAVAPDGANASGQLSELGRQVEGLQQQLERMQFRPASTEVRVETRSVEGEHTVERVKEVSAPAPAPAPVPAERRPVRTQAPVFVQPRATQRAAPQLEAHEQANGRTPEPTVNVTIGRIEVRAAQTAEAPARREGREQPPAAMSLREYLRKRSGGHSR